METEMELKNRNGREGGAEVVLNLQPHSSISIAYHPLFGPHDDLVLLELDEKLIPDILQERVTLRGQPNEDAVLCTSSKTYAVKFVGTSNSVFLMPPSDQFASRENVQDCDEKDSGKMMVASVLKVAPGNMELVEVAPRLDKLKLLLSENPYSFYEASQMEDSEGTEKIDFGLYRWEDLVDRIQASDSELRSELEALFAVEVNGFWRILDEDYKDGLLNMLLHNSVLNDWSFDALSEDDVVAVLVADGFPCNIARHCLQIYGHRVDGGIGGSCTWRLDETRVCVHFARRILRGGKMRLENFMEEWMKKVPEGMHARFDMLEGEILTEKLAIETWIYAFSVSSLPSTPAERFSILFQERPKWEWKDLDPYVRDLKVPGLSSESLLLKYTRRTQPTLDAEPIFTAR
ncbi:sister chromatid cohesion protein DCC1 [Coffea eugenioides]|uniref:sister chromatid cohesion protein DCC1 n=1 Tax=Coffea eugenioides TaxID=49369 RepID=UPI000F608640|nr:sister chromatid cohesion protein DCC1 [Coffea eugenioides]